MIPKIISQISTVQQIPICYTFYPNTDPSAPFIIYLHGGGLMFGQRDDLPEEYLQLFLQAGYSFLTIDYLLAPESKLREILANLNESLNHLLERLQIEKFVLMGRSAGAYLAYSLATTLNPCALLLFYGYFHLNVPEFSLPAPAYLNYPLVAPMMVDSLIGTQPLTTAPLAKRFPIYLASRQSGNWLKRLIDNPTDMANFSLSEEQLKKLPPTVLLHAKKDPDVPFSCSDQASKLIPVNHFITIDSDEHDFDRIVTAENLSAYQTALNFLTKTNTMNTKS